MDPANAKKGPRLFASSVLEPRDELDERHDKCYFMVQALIADKGDTAANDALAVAVSKDPKAHEDVCLGLLVGILADPDTAPRLFRDLTLVSRDGMVTACNHLNQLVLDKYPKMLPACKQQLLWLTREMIKASVTSMENICWNLMRQIAGGDVSRPNLWLADHLLDIFSEHRKWLEKFPFLLASVVYNYLRIIEDHIHVEKLLGKEIRFVISLMRERFGDVIVIGRDLVRVLQYVAKIPEFEALWNDIIFQPKTLHPNFGGITQLMHTRTSRRFLQSRITPEMEKKLVFLTSSVRFGSHKRYQEWFQRQYLATSESQSLRCDLIRFIVGVIHPTNELLGSDIIPRWAVIGWLLTTCTNQVASSNAKLALFYDWLYFAPDKDNIMNIEPAILVMHHSMRPHPAITATLLDFLCRIITNFFPREQEKVRAGIYNSISTILDKRVLPSIGPLFQNARLDRELRQMLAERFAPFFSSKGAEPGIVLEETDPSAVPDNSPRFSDDEDDDVKTILAPVTAAASAPQGKKRKARRSTSSAEENEEDEVIDIDDDLKELLKDIKNEKEGAKKCELVDNVVKAVIEEQVDYDQCKILAKELAEALPEEFEGEIFPATDPSAQAIEDSIGRPIFVLFRSLCEMNESESSRGVVLQLLADLYELHTRIGYYLLYFLNADNSTAGRTAKERAAVYKDLCEAIDSKYSLDICLVNDMRQCLEDSVDLFVFLVPELYTNFPKHAIGNVDLLYLVVSCVDGRQVQTLICPIVAKDFVICKKDSFATVLQSSLAWETFEQYTFWQLVGAHDLPMESMISVISKLNYPEHAEALTHILLLVKHERPTQELLRAIFTREFVPGDCFLSSLLINWMADYDEKLGDLIASHLSKAASMSSGTKRKRGAAASAASGALSPLSELCLLHLDALRQHISEKQTTDFFSQHNMQSALQNSRVTCTEAQKKKFMDLFSLAESDSEPEPVSRKGGSKKGASKSPGKRKYSPAVVKVTDSSEVSSEESEEEEKPIKAKGVRGGRGSGGKAGPRKRASKVSYKISSEESSDEEVNFKKAPKKKKKVSHSDSD